MGELTAEVVGVGNLLFIGLDHLQESVVAVVGPLGHVGGNGLIRHNHLAAGLRQLAHLAIEILNGTRSVLTEHQAAYAVLGSVSSTIVILYVILRVVRIVDGHLII